jgi:hypothetical protein
MKTRCYAVAIHLSLFTSFASIIPFAGREEKFDHSVVTTHILSLLNC